MTWSTKIIKIGLKNISHPRPANFDFSDKNFSFEIRKLISFTWFILQLLVYCSNVYHLFELFRSEKMNVLCFFSSEKNYWWRCFSYTLLLLRSRSSNFQLNWFLSISWCNTILWITQFLQLDMLCFSVPLFSTSLVHTYRIIINQNTIILLFITNNKWG